MIYLNVPFRQKDQAKAVGARWDAMAKKWYVPAELSENLEPFSLWLPNTPLETLQPATDHLFTQSAPETTDASGVQQMLLSHYLGEVQSVISGTFSQGQWIVAEISNVQNRRGHLYLELSENSESGQTLASCRAMIWADRVATIEKKFAQTTGQSLEIGQKVLLNGSATFHSQFGFSIQINDIDPAFTLGDIERHLQQVRTQLKEQGLYQLNQQLIAPKDYFCLAVIAPPNAAGLGDFQAEASRLQQHGLCQFDYYPATFQGERTESEILSAITQIQASSADYQAVIVLRGGGAKLDLHHLNNYAIAAALAQLSVPVYTGIGHERDNTLLDEIAHTRFDTPSKVIAFIEKTLVNIAQIQQRQWQFINSQVDKILWQQKSQLQHLHTRLEQNSRQLVAQQQEFLNTFKQSFAPKVHLSLAHNRASLDRAVSQVQQSSQAILRNNKQLLSHHHTQIEVFAKQKVHQQKQTLEQLMRYVLGAGAQTQLQRGFAIVKQNNTAITKVSQLQLESDIQLQMQDGQLTATIKQIKQTEDES